MCGYILSFGMMNKGIFFKAAIMDLNVIGIVWNLDDW